MATTYSNGTVGVTTKISKDEALSAIRCHTIEMQPFDPRKWSIGDIEDLERIARFVREELTGSSIIVVSCDFAA